MLCNATGWPALKSAAIVGAMGADSQIGTKCSVMACTAFLLRARAQSTITMLNTPRKIAFLTAATDHGTMIVNRFDQHFDERFGWIGMGFQLFDKSCYDAGEVGLLLNLLDLRREHHGDGVVAVDCGANIGVHTIEWARHMTGWGVVIAIEAQERIYYALAGNIAINNCFNARAIHAAVGSQAGTMKIPTPNYLAPASFGSLELRRRPTTQFIGQLIDYSEDKMVDVRAVCLDSFNFPRLDLIKIDVEGMELEALAGGAKCIGTHHPIMLIESLKTDPDQLRTCLQTLGYTLIDFGMNLIAVHKGDKCLPHLKTTAAVDV
jgi:FkbM family methyltransferase